MKSLFTDGNNIYTYDIVESNKEKILEQLTSYAKEGVIERSGKGPYGIEHRTLFWEIMKSCDQILEVEFKEGKGNERYGGDLNVSAVAIVKYYPVLYRIVKDLHSLQELLDYMKGDVLIRKAYRSQVAFEVARSINVLSPQSSNENKFYYDKNISFNKKIQILQEYLSGLQFRLVETKSLEKIKEEIYLLKGMQEDELQQSLIIKKENQLEEAKRNTEVFKELCQLSQYRVDDEKIFTKRR